MGRQAYAFYEFDAVMRASNPDHVAVSYPPVSSSDWFISGYAEGAEELGGTAAVVDEPVGAGRATVFSVEPNFRAFTTGFQKILRNALLGADAGRRPCGTRRLVGPRPAGGPQARGHQLGPAAGGERRHGRRVHAPCSTASVRATAQAARAPRWAS